MIVECQERIRLRMRGGGSFDDVEAEIIERSGLDKRQKAALWLYAWSFLPKRIQRAEAARLAAYLESEPNVAAPAKRRTGLERPPVHTTCAQSACPDWPNAPRAEGRLVLCGVLRAARCPRRRDSSSARAENRRSPPRTGEVLR